jgi:hypothetical protein
MELVEKTLPCGMALLSKLSQTRRSPIAPGPIGFETGLDLVDEAVELGIGGARLMQKWRATLLFLQKTL